MTTQKVRNESVSTSATSVEVAPARPSPYYKRTQIIIVNTSAAAIVTICKGDQGAVAGAGIRLQPNGYYAEATDGGYQCWQGPIQAVSDVAGTIGIVEAFENDN